MRKFRTIFLVILLTLTLTVVLSACGKSNTNTDTPAASDTDTNATAPTDNVSTDTNTDAATDATADTSTDATADTTDTSDQTAATAPDGSGLYTKNCEGCHGKGGANGFAPALVNIDLDQAQITDIISNGEESMPGYKDSLSSDEIKAIADYVLTLK